MALTSLKSSSGRKDKSNSSKRKLEKRLSFHAKVKDAAATSLGAKKAINKKKRLRCRQKKLKAYDLSALSEFLQDLDVPQQPPDATDVKLNCKSRQKLVQRESAQLRAVLNNPAFQMDPISAIQHHLESTQPAPPPVTTKKEGTRNRPGSAKRKNKAKKKGANGPSQALSHLWICDKCVDQGVRKGRTRLRRRELMGHLQALSHLWICDKCACIHLIFT